MHQIIGSTLRVFSTLNPPGGVQDAYQIVDTAIANAFYGTRATFHRSLKTTPGALTYHSLQIFN